MGVRVLTEEASPSSPSPGSGSSFRVLVSGRSGAASELQPARLRFGPFLSSSPSRSSRLHRAPQTVPAEGSTRKDPVRTARLHAASRHRHETKAAPRPLIGCRRWITCSGEAVLRTPPRPTCCLFPASKHAEGGGNGRRGAAACALLSRFHYGTC